MLYVLIWNSSDTQHIYIRIITMLTREKERERSCKWESMSASLTACLLACMSLYDGWNVCKFARTRKFMLACVCVTRLSIKINQQYCFNRIDIFTLINSSCFTTRKIVMQWFLFVKFLIFVICFLFFVSYCCPW